MRAFLLAAGLGTRLRPLTNTVPKCLVDIGGVPLLKIWFALLTKHNINQVLINTHHLSESVYDYIKNNEFDLKITLTKETKLLGSAGTIKHNKEFVQDCDNFFIMYADNLTCADLTLLKQCHYRGLLDHDMIMTMGLFRSNNPSECGIATIDERHRLSAFEEKPAEPKSDLANAGIYVSTQEIFDYIPKNGCYDISKDVIPRMIKKINTYEIDEFLMDIGTLQNLKEARRLWRHEYIWA